ncbi:GAF domain-containing sensor histidine kinase [Xylophilus sp. GOD-11R]|uniref:GAF domain-containing sensor histidine kinase n=1 Tax=Xylophilus sp. GOD-11R TaxID=3089814 RepID=UPI00298C452F|nr:GAF domain-containing sensor histidine kinase [Xylophilus sp. GOD-11R]WPB58429.1 GAF domain-containing sensor histidine kinase [Xylophilus sp. GOD-11R]
MELTDDPAEIARDVAAVGRVSTVPALLKIVCQHTGMRFAAVARVTDGTWTACAVQDDIAFGLPVGGQLEVNTTLCVEARAARKPIAFDHASTDPVFAAHHTPRIYGIESYVSVPIVLPDGTYFGNLCAIDPAPNVVSDARTLDMFKLFAEVIAAQLHLEDSQKASSEALACERETSQLREQFIAVLGHDLRNPVSAVAGAGELLLRRGGDPDLLRIGERLRRTARRMSGLIDDVLDLARTRLGNGIGLDRERIDDVSQAWCDVVDELVQAHPDRDIRLKLMDVGCRVNGDRGRLQQLLSNLLGNALAHGSPDEPIVVSAHTEGGDVVLWVANGGAVIPADTLEKIFQPYWRPATSRPGGGLGLGLYICREIVRAHGGSIQARSSAEEGTVFEVRLPVVAG